jgi:hypothetical protein
MIEVPSFGALDSYNVQRKKLQAAQRRAPFAESLRVSLISVTGEMVLYWLAGGPYLSASQPLFSLAYG